jgi:hypothetical protein
LRVSLAAPPNNRRQKFIAGERPWVVRGGIIRHKIAPARGGRNAVEAPLGAG